MNDDLRVSFEKLVGDSILIATDAFGGQRKIITVTLRGVESGGLWIESAEFMQETMRDLKQQALPKTLVLFLPYHRIHFAISTIGLVSLSDSAFGIKE